MFNLAKSVKEIQNQKKKAEVRGAKSSQKTINNKNKNKKFQQRACFLSSSLAESLEKIQPAVYLEIRRVQILCLGVTIPRFEFLADRDGL